MILDTETWSKFGTGCFIKDCTLGFNENRLGFLLIEEVDADADLEDGWKTALVVLNLEQPMSQRYFTMSGNNWGILTGLTCSWLPNQTEYVAVSVSRKSWSFKPKEYKGFEGEIPFDGSGYGYADAGRVGCAILKTVRIDSYIFAVGSPFRIFERTNDRKWTEHKDIPLPEGLKSKNDQLITEILNNSDFYDLAGFSKNDMYAVGGAGTVWHRKGTDWKQMPFPGNLRLHTVACAADGFVYISDIRGSVWKGREDKWEQVVKSDLSLPFTDSVWFDDRLWLANDYGTWVLEGKSLIPAHSAKNKPMPADSAVHAHRLDISPDGKRMLVAGGKGASMFDGKTWQVLFDFNNPTEAA